MQIQCRNKTIMLDSTRIMGILNVTPDSFSDGGKWTDTDLMLKHVQDMINDGADIIDIGGESTRPGAPAISVDEELRRVIPAVKAIREKFDIPLSIDTSQGEVMRQAVDAGADIWNDIRALRLNNAAKTAAALDIPVILMHMQGNPQTMQIDPHYTDVVKQVKDFLLKRIDEVISEGVRKENIIIDLGFGFGKNIDHNFKLLNATDEFVKLGYPVLCALSRKSMIGAATMVDKPEQRVIGSVAGALLAVCKGAQIVRVHDVKETKEALLVFEQMKKSEMYG